MNSREATMEISPAQRAGSAAQTAFVLKGRWKIRLRFPASFQDTHAVNDCTSHFVAG
jgi:hypothetical protein